jgi:predicted acetyltransferase
MDELIIKQLTTPEDALRYSRLASIAFHSKNAGLADENAYKEHAAQSEAKALANKTRQGNHRTRTGLFRGEQLLSTLTAHAFEVNFDGNICEMCGIGGVMSDPAARRSGGVTRVLCHEFTAMRERGQIFSHLYPFQTSFYRKFGYEHCAFSVKWTIPIQFLPTGNCGSIQFFENTPLQQQDVRQVYTGFAARYNLAVDRSDTRWEDFFNAHAPYTSGIYAYLHYGASGPDAFLAYRMPSPDEASTTLTVADLYFTTADALRQMLIFLGQFRAYASEVILSLPQDVDISNWLTELCSAYDKCNVRREIIHRGASRVVDVAQALRLAKYQGCGSADLKILDPVCPWNNKCFHVEFDQRCLSVTETDRFDISLDIGDFTALLLGQRPLSQAAYLPSVQIFGNRSALEKIFYTKPVYIMDSF